MFLRIAIRYKIFIKVVETSKYRYFITPESKDLDPPQNRAKLEHFFLALFFVKTAFLIQGFLKTYPKGRIPEDTNLYRY